MLWILIHIVYLFVTICLGVIILLWAFQEHLVFHPNSASKVKDGVLPAPSWTLPEIDIPPEIEALPLPIADKGDDPYTTPDQYGLPFEDCYFYTVDGVKVHGWMIPQPHPELHATLIFLPGGSSSMGYRLPNVKHLYTRLRVNIFILSYRGYGQSGGIPSEPGLYRDAEASLDYIIQRCPIDPTRIFAFGRSIGAAPAIQLAIRRPRQIRALVLENGFSSLRKLLYVLFPFLRILQPFVPWIQRIHMSNEEMIADVRCPILLINGAADELVPNDHTMVLHDAAVNACARMVLTVPNGDHNNCWFVGGEPYYNSICRFLEYAVPEDYE